MILTFQDFISQYEDTQEFQKYVSDEFLGRLREYPNFQDYRNWVASNGYGYGETEFTYLWKLIFDYFQAKNTDITFCEVGVFKGQTLALAKYLWNSNNKLTRVGVTPLARVGNIPDSNYLEDIITLHNTFNIEKDYILVKGLSQDKDIIEQVKKLAPFDILYIDGSHEYEDVLIDIDTYCPMVKKGGILVMDDSANNLEGSRGERFWGIPEVSDATDKRLPPKAINSKWIHLGHVVHNRVFQKK